MNNLFEEKRILFLLLLSLIFLGLLTLYLFFLQPLSLELQSKKNANVTLEGDIAILEAKNNAETGPADVDSLLLARKIPLHPDLEKLLLSFQEVEQTSKSRIEQMEFQYDGSEPEFDIKENDENQSNNQETDTQEVGNPEEEEHSDEDSTKPEELHLVTAELEVLSPDYEHFIEFIKEVEKIERITRVDKLEFSHPTEETLMFQKDPNETISFSIVVTTFYFEK